MSDSVNTQKVVRPGPWNYFLYCYGKVLGPKYHAWVEQDLSSKGAPMRIVVRFTIPAIIILSPLLLFPASAVVHASMTLPILIPFVYFAFALNKVYRRHRLSQHGLDPEKAEELRLHKERHDRAAYERRYGPR